MNRLPAQRLVVGYDYSPVADQNVLRAFQRADREEGAEVDVITVISFGESDATCTDFSDGAASDSLACARIALEKRVTTLLALFQATTGRSLDRVFAHVHVAKRPTKVLKKSTAWPGPHPTTPPANKKALCWS